MKNNIAGKLVSITLLAVMLAGFMLPANFFITVKAATPDVEGVIDDILSWKHNGSAQSLIDDISDDMGSSIADWYAISLSRYKYSLDFSKCKSSLDSFTSSTSNLRATDKQRIAIAYTAMGYDSSYINTAINNSIGDLGIMSYIYGLIMLDCGAYHGSITRNDVINQILSLQSSDGGWGLMQNSDVDVTAMAIQALARYYKHSDVKSAVNKALNYLSQRQQSSGSFKSYGTENAESTAQVLLALNTMKINYKTDTRFIKNGNTVYDGLMQFRKSNGGFSHTLSGDTNQIATVQSLYSLISLWRYENGKSSFFEFVSNNIERETTEKTTSKPSSDVQSSNNPTQSSSHRPNNNSNSNVTSTVQNEKNSSNQSIDNSTSRNTETQAQQNTTSSKAESDSSQSSSNVSKAEISEKSIEVSSENTLTAESGESQKSDSIISAEDSNTNKISTEDCVIHDYTNYKLIFVICIVGIFVAVLIVLIVRKKLNQKNLIVLAVLFAALIAVTLVIKIETPNQYYDEASNNSKSESGTVVMSISCENAVGKTNNDKMPSDGIILNDTEFSIENGETVFDVLLSATKKNRIQFDYEGGSENDYGFVYVKGINYLYEFDCGELSGWMYKVNGETPNVGCSGYELKDGDVVEWVYTTNLGKDIIE